ncbi:MAG: cytidylate kinase-like family protein, partial [Selenomonas sp.]|nr:cytidylate kinase-like family protein [Selenomonas sp.]
MFDWVVWCSCSAGWCWRRQRLLPSGILWCRGTSSIPRPISQKVFLAQFDTIKKIAEEGPCVIVGRCADYALENRDNVINLFIYADEDFKVNRIMKLYDLDAGKARDMIAKKDKQ